MWFCVTEAANGEPIFDTYNFRRWGSASYPINRDGEWISDQWWLLVRDANAQRIQSGILADWLEDHRSELLTGCTGDDTERRLDGLIAYLRQRFNEFSKNAID